MTHLTLFSPHDSQKVGALSRRVARELGLAEADVELVGRLAGVHDVGRRTLPEHILRKTTPLSPTEIGVLHGHPEAGAEFVGSIPKLAHLAPLVRALHERWDGGGYPAGLRGEQIPLPCRIVYACEAFVALLAERPYREALDPAVVEEVFRRNAGTQFCPAVSGALMRVVAPAQAAAPVPAPVSHAPAAPASAPVVPAPARVAARDHRPAPAHALTPAQRRQAGRVARHNPRRRATVVYALGALAGVAFALVMALPVESVADRCPPAGEGLVQCQVQKVGLKLTMIFLLSILAGGSIAHFVAFSVPNFIRRWRSGEFSRPDAPFPTDDPVLVAAHWGFVPESENRSRVLRRHRFERA